MTLKRWALLAGHDFREAKINQQGFIDKECKSGIICYNCGVWTVVPNCRRRVYRELYLGNTIPQCPAFQVDLFGGMAFNSKDLPRQIPRTRSKK